MEKLTLCERLFLMECDMPFESATTIASVDAGEEVGIGGRHGEPKQTMAAVTSWVRREKHDRGGDPIG